MNERFSRRFTAALDEVIAFLREVSGFLDARNISGKPAYAARLIFEELLTNTVKYGAGAGKAVSIDASLSVDSDRVTIVIEDNGSAFDPSRAEAPAVHPLEETRPGGLGLHLVRSFADELSYESRDGRNRIRAVVRREKDS